MTYTFNVHENSARESINDLCSYYGVTPEDARALGTRSSGRRPNLPGSKTCEPVTGMTMEDIWNKSSRESLSDVFQFYVDLGAWASFRQCVRHLDLFSYHAAVLNSVGIVDGMHIVEYGCGVAPFVWSMLNSESIGPSTNLTVTLTDVPSEHYTFGIWRINRLLERKGLKNVKLCTAEVTHTTLPVYIKPIDVAMAFEVFEHVHDPLAAIVNLVDQMNVGCRYVENFIKHASSGKGGPDLETAQAGRDAYYAFLNDRLTQVVGAHPSADANATRVWVKQE